MTVEDTLVQQETTLALIPENSRSGFKVSSYSLSPSWVIVKVLSVKDEKLEAPFHSMSPAYPILTVWKTNEPISGNVYSWLSCGEIFM